MLVDFVPFGPEPSWSTGKLMSFFLVQDKGYRVILKFKSSFSDPCCALKYYPGIEECVRVRKKSKITNIK